MPMRRPQIINLDCNRADYEQERKAFEALGADLLLRKARTEDEIIGLCRAADIVLLEAAGTPLTARVIDTLENCRAIIKYSVGYENVDLAAASRRGIVVANAAEFCTEEVSDHTVALLLACVRRILSLDRRVRDGGWDEPGPTRRMRRVRNLILGLVGMGRIGRAVVRKMSGFQMRILVSDPYLAAPSLETGVELVTMERLLRESDLISIHAPLTPATRGLIGEAEFRSMKPSAILVNTSRGAVVDQDALVRALREHRIAGAALDVVVKEPLPGGDPLRGLHNVILTAHTAARSEDSYAHARAIVLDSVQAILRGYWPPFPVNPEVRPRFPLKP